MLFHPTISYYLVLSHLMPLLYPFVLPVPFDISLTLFPFPFFHFLLEKAICLEQDHGRSCGFIILSTSNSLQNGVVDFEGHLRDPNSSNCSIPSLHYKMIFKFSATPQKIMLKTGLYFGRLQLQFFYKTRSKMAIIQDSSPTKS